MKGGRSLAAVTGRHFQAFRKSQRTTMAVLCEGLAAVGRLGLAPIARGHGSGDDGAAPDHAQVVSDLLDRHNLSGHGRFASRISVGHARTRVGLLPPRPICWGRARPSLEHAKPPLEALERLELRVT